MSNSIADRPLQLFCLGADSGEHLLAEAERWNHYVAQHQPSLSDLSRSMHAKPVHGPHRLALLAANLKQLQTQLRAVQKGSAVAGAMRDVVPAGHDVSIAFLFSGDGAQYPGMGRALFAAQPAFRDAMLACEQHLVQHMRGGLIAKLYGADAGAWLEHPLHRAAALFAVQYSLAQLWRALGVSPAYVMGYSAGEVAAATVAGALSLVDAIDIRMARVKALMRASQPGGSALVFAPGEALASLLEKLPEVSIAAYRGVASTVVAGSLPALATFLDACHAKGLATQRLTVNHGLHSPWVESVMPWLRGELESRRWSPPTSTPVPWLSAMTAKIQPPHTARQASYWCEQIRRPVRFAQSLQALSEQGVDMFIEVGPNTPLLALGRPILPSRRHVWLPSIRREASDMKTLYESLGVLHTCGAQINVQAPEMVAGLDPHFSRIVS